MNHLRGGLPADGRLHHGFDVGHVDAVARNFVAVGVNQQARLAEFAHDGEFAETGDLREPPLDLEGFVLQDIQIGTVNFHGQRALQTGERFVHGVLGGLRVIENHAGKGVELSSADLPSVPLCYGSRPFSTSNRRRVSGRHKIRR